MTQTSNTYAGQTLSYEITETGYNIYLGDSTEHPWITQPNGSPYAGATMEEKCLNHIADIVAGEQASNSTPTVEELTEKITALSETIAKLEVEKDVQAAAIEEMSSLIAN